MLFAVLATVLYLACLICAWGFISLLTGTDVIAEPVGPLVGPIMAAVACIVLFFCTLFSIRSPRTALAWPGAILAAAAVYLGPAIVGGVIVALDRVDPLAGLLFLAERVTGPYVPTAAVLAGVVVLVSPFVRSGRRG